MARANSRFPAVQPYYPEIDDEIIELAGVRGVAYPMEHGCRNRLAELVARVQVANVLLKNELCDLFKEFYRHDDWSSVLEAALRTGRNYPVLQLVARKMRLEVLEEKYFHPSPPSTDSFGNQSD